MLKKYFIISILCAFFLFVGLGLSPSFCQADSNSAMVDVDDEFAEYDELVVVVNDPLEGLNRAVFSFNHNLQIWFMEPVAKTYSKVTPSMFRTGVHNFFSNLLEPTRFINSLLQGRFIESRDTFFRFLLNSTVGVCGLMDPASYDGMKLNERRFASTLAHYGVGSGPYLVLPLYGPSNPRGIAGLLGDTLTSPLFYILNDDPLLVVVLEASKTVNTTSFRLGEYEKMISSTLDPYIAIRNAFTQHQQELMD
ncbi:MAG: VacJ family lipoprotein [Deltaproteobacteria bacterium]|nr:VacJ family lipoprotein [Deltaproteobacteria bacterium]